MTRVVTAIVVAVALVASSVLAQSQQPASDANKVYVYVTGAVGKPGRFVLTEKMTVLELIDRAGGLKPFADDLITIISATQKDAQGRPVVVRRSIQSMKGATRTKNAVLLGPGDQVLIAGRNPESRNPGAPNP